MGLETFLMLVKTPHEVVDGAAKSLPPVCQETAAPSREAGRKTEHPTPVQSADRGLRELQHGVAFAVGHVAPLTSAGTVPRSLQVSHRLRVCQAGALPSG